MKMVIELDDGVTPVNEDYTRSSKARVLQQIVELALEGHNDTSGDGFEVTATRWEKSR